MGRIAGRLCGSSAFLLFTGRDTALTMNSVKTEITQ